MTLLARDFLSEPLHGSINPMGRRNCCESFEWLYPNSRLRGEIGMNHHSLSLKSSVDLLIQHHMPTPAV